MFKEAGQVLTTTVTDELTVPGTGLFAAIKVDKSEIVPVALASGDGAVPIVSQTAGGSQQASTYEPPAAELEFAARTGLQLFFRRVDAAGQEGEDVELPPELLERGLFDVFQRFPNGRYRIYLKEPNSDRERLIQEVNVYQGRIVPPDFRDNASERQMGEESEKPKEPRPADEPKAEDVAGRPRRRPRRILIRRAWKANRPAANRFSPPPRLSRRAARPSRWERPAALAVPVGRPC